MIHVHLQVPPGESVTLEKLRSPGMDGHTVTEDKVRGDDVVLGDEATIDDQVKRDDDSATKYATGSLVAVAYDHNFYVGEISDLGEDDCRVRFMVHVSGERFKWGGKKSELIHKSFLLDTLPTLAPCDGSLRVFKVEN